MTYPAGLRAPAVLITTGLLFGGLGCRPETPAMQKTLATPNDTGTDGAAWLVDATAEAGIDFVHTTGASGGLYLPEIMGGGVAVFDADGDGLLDLYFVNQNRGLDGAPPDATAVNRLFLQATDGRFTDATEDSGLADRGYGNGVAIGDVDNDGDLDVYVTNLGPDRLYRNRGDGRFEEARGAVPTATDGLSVSAAFLDYDRDGDLDLWVTRYVRWNDATRCSSTGGEPTYCGPRAFPPASDRLLRNEGGRFSDVSTEAGIDTTFAAGLGVIVGDFDDDGWPDVYVANDAYANNLWLNQRDGRFVDLAVPLGAAYNELGQPEAGMGLAAGDLDGDGLGDLFVTHLDRESNTFYRRLPDGAGFADATAPSGLGRPSWHLTGFGVAALDLELDGDLDLAVVNGRVTFAETPAPSTVPPPWDRLAESNQLFINQGEGRFLLGEGGLVAFSGPTEVSRGLIAADLDRDGDQDLVVANIESGPRYLRNESPRRGDWLAVTAIDPRYQRDAIGARVTLERRGIQQTRIIRRATSYASSGPAIASFSLPLGGSYDRLRVRWPDGLEETFPGGSGNRRVSLRRGEGLAP